jgi:hypothetical protein
VSLSYKTKVVPVDVPSPLIKVDPCKEIFSVPISELPPTMKFPSELNPVFQK